MKILKRMIKKTRLLGGGGHDEELDRDTANKLAFKCNVRFY